MRVDVKKFLFIGARKDKIQFFNASQKVGMIEFIHPKGIKSVFLSPEAQKLKDAIKVLREYVQEEQDHKKDLAIADTIASQILELKRGIERAEEEKRVVSQEIDRISPFGEFSMDTIHSLERESGYKVRFYCAKSSKQIETIDPSLILINSEDGIDYCIAITDKLLTHPEAIEIHITESVSSLKKHYEMLEKSIVEAHEELRRLTRYDMLLHYALIYHINSTSLISAKDCAELYLDEQLFVVEGWVPERQIANVRSLAKTLDILMDEVAIEGHDAIPTYLENKRIARVGEDLIQVFDTPSIKDKDPSLWVLFAFSLFFSMIVGDAGYGLVFLATALFLQFKLKKVTRFGRRMIMLIGLLGISCMLWGGLTHSFFGIELSKDNFFRQHSMMNWLVEKKAAYHLKQKDDVYQEWVVKYPELATCTNAHDFLYPSSIAKSHSSPIVSKFSDNILLELALFIGSIHIIFGLLRYLGKNPTGAGWIAFIAGAYLYLPHYLHATSLLNFAFGVNKVKAAEFGLHLLCFGVVLAVVIAIIKQGITGIFECMTAIQVFADILSYLRIYALGLAGAIVAGTINQLAGSLPLLVAIVLIVSAHILNIVLSIMGGVIHGLRLNFLEWYRYSFEGGGKKFRPLSLHSLENL